MGGSLPTAFLVCEDRLYQTFQFQKPTPQSPWTPVTALIEGIWAHDPEFARKILRQAITTRFSTTPICDSMIKVAAKRITILTEEDFTLRWGYSLDLETITVEPTMIQAENDFDAHSLFTDEEAMKFAVELSKRSKIAEQAYESDRAVGAVLLSEQGKILNVAWNTNSSNRTLHAELKLIRGYLSKHQKPIPEGSRLLVTLQPCAMCAAQIFEFTKSPEKMTIHYLKPDPGPLAQNTVFIPGSDLWKKAGSPKLNSTLFPHL